MKPATALSLDVVALFSTPSNNDDDNDVDDLPPSDLSALSRSFSCPSSLSSSPHRCDPCPLSPPSFQSTMSTMAFPRRSSPLLATPTATTAMHMPPICRLFISLPALIVLKLSAFKDLAKKEEGRKKELQKEKEYVEQQLKVKIEELSRRTLECTKLQERNLGLAKELAALKLATDLNLGEEEMVKLASLGHGSNPENIIDVLKKSLALRNKSYKELISQCNILGRSDTRARQKLDKSKEKIRKLNARLQELEKALEQKENEILRNLKSSYKDKAGNPVDEIAKSNHTSFLINHSDPLKITPNCHEVQNASTSLPSNKHNSLIDLETDSVFMDEDILNLSPEMNDEHMNHDSDFEEPHVPVKGAAFPNPAYLDANVNNDKPDRSRISGINMQTNDNGISDKVISRKVTTHTSSSTWTTETLIIDDISKQTPSFAVKKEVPTYDAAGCSGANRHIGKWCQPSSVQTATRNGELISVGSDGRGGRVKVLREHDQALDAKAKALWPKKHKYKAKQSGQFHIEHFFKTGSYLGTTEP